MNEEQVNKMKIYFEDAIKKNNERISQYKAMMVDDINKTNFYQKRIDELNRINGKHEDKLRYLRPDSQDDLNMRADLLIDYARKVKETIPQGIPIVFHGRPNIGTIEKIIKSGGLSTPDERGEEFRSFATQIDVSTSKDISVSLEFAEPKIGCGLPYGAIFAFLPEEDEKDKVLQTNGTEVYNGVKSVNFRKHPERLVGIITTDENIERIKEWCMLYGLDSNKVFNHDEFLLECKKKYEQESYNGAQIASTFKA